MSNSLWPHGLQHGRPPCPSHVYAHVYPVSKAQYAGGERVKLSEIKFWPCCVTQGKLINLSAHLFLPLSKGNDTMLHTVLLWKLNKETDVNSLTNTCHITRAYSMRIFFHFWNLWGCLRSLALEISQHFSGDAWEIRNVWEGAQKGNRVLRMSYGHQESRTWEVL